jgi:glyoxylate reductase
VEVWPGRLPPAPVDLHAACSEADGLLCLLTDRVDAALLDAAPRLRAVSVFAVGLDNVDLAAATARGIQVGHTPGVLTETTADLAFGLLLAAARRIAEGERDVRAGRWPVWAPGAYLGEEVHAATLGIVGLGRIGSAMARRASGFGMEVIHTSRSGGMPLEHLLEASDFVSLHAPLTSETRGLIGETQLARMKPTAVLVNTARGELVDTDALVDALRGGRIAAAGLDVTDPEPLPPDHPLLVLDTAVITPHIGSASRRTRELMADMAVDNLLAALRGERMPHLSNPEVAGRLTGS